MNAHYDDILKLIEQRPVWFDERAVPRFCKPHPADVTNIYSNEVAFAQIACQNCHSLFVVAFSVADFEVFTKKRRPLREMIVDQTLHYGDPPNIACCASGPTMNSEMVQVLEYWKRGKDFEWKRDSKLEIVFDEEPE